MRIAISEGTLGFDAQILQQANCSRRYGSAGSFAHPAAARTASITS